MTEEEVIESQQYTEATNEETFPFLRLSFDLQYRVIEKLEFSGWSQLRQCCRLSNSVSDAIRRRLPFSIQSINVSEKKVRVTPGYFIEKHYYDIAWKQATKFPSKCNASLLSIESTMTSQKIKKLYKTFLFKEVSANYISFHKEVTCEAEELVSLVELLTIVSLQCSSHFKAEFFDFPIAQKLSAIYLRSCRMTDKQLLSLKAETIMVRCDTITTKAINRFIKEWLDGKRELNMFEITAESSQIGRSEEELVEGLAINPVWSPDLHETSIISPIPSHELREFWNNDPRSYYCMWRSSEIYRCRKLQLNREQLRIHNGNDKDVFYHLLTDDQYYSVFNKRKGL